MPNTPLTNISSPDNPTTLLHFTGRTTNAGAPTDTIAGGRLSSILEQAIIRGYKTHGTQNRVVCFADLSNTALLKQLASGFTYRGRYRPWAVAINKAQAYAKGARPVWYADDNDFIVTDHVLPPDLLDRRVYYRHGFNDWTHEREWRMSPHSENPQTEFGLYLDPDILSAVITGEPGWTPKSVFHTLQGHPIPRLLWTGYDLEPDGTIAEVPTTR